MALINLAAGCHNPGRMHPISLLEAEIVVDSKDRCMLAGYALLQTAKKMFPEETIQFQEAIMQRSGISEKSAIANGLSRYQDGKMQTATWSDALEETETVIYSCVEQVLRQSGIQPQEIDIVIVSCSCFAPTPSMAAMLVNHFKFREDVLTYNLSGMGCSSSLICVDMVKHLLQALPNKLALVVNHENVTHCFYLGHERPFLVCNCLFRMGGAAVLLSNRSQDRRRAKYDLIHTVRTHTGNDNDSFGCMGVMEDSKGILGVFLKRNVIAVAGRAMAKNIRRLAPLVLPYSELYKAWRHPNYVPNFKTCFKHFLLHTGGRGVLDELEKTLQLSQQDMAPSRSTLFRFGNTSAASTWYILSFIEHHGLMKKGDRAWQLGFGDYSLQVASSAIQLYGEPNALYNNPTSVGVIELAS